MTSVIEFAYQDMKEFYLLARKCWQEFEECRELYIARGNYPWRVGAIAYKQTSDGMNLLADYGFARERVTLSALTVIAAKAYQDAMNSDIDIHL